MNPYERWQNFSHDRLESNPKHYISVVFERAEKFGKIWKLFQTLYNTVPLFNDS